MQIKNYLNLLRWAPIVGPYLRKKILQKHFCVEMELIKGRHYNNNKHPSILHFSVNKAATQHVKGILRRCASENSLVNVDIHGYAFNTDFPYLDHLSAGEMEKYQYLFKPTGYLYSVFGGMIEGIPEIKKYLIIFMVRDPRDILVSEYYSVAYSHPEPNKLGNKYKGFMTRRRNARETTIDEYVLAKSDKIHSVYHRYKTLLLDNTPNVYVTRYEDMVSNYQRWLKSLLDYCELEISDALLQSLLEENNRLRPKKEDIYKHIRKGKPEDYKDKLRAETVDSINSKFGQVFELFNYT